MKKVFIVLLAFGSALLASGHGEGDIVLFTKLKGTLTYNGEALDGVTVKRNYTGIGHDDYIEERETTNEMGEFSFETVIGNLGIMAFLPHEAVIHQEIKVNYMNKEYLLWYAVKRNYDYLGEFNFLDNKPILPKDMMAGYNEGYILLNIDLHDVLDSEGKFQRVDDHVSILSVKDFNFPYEVAIKKYQSVIVERNDEFTALIRDWFKENPDFFNYLLEEMDSWQEYESTELEPYIGARVIGVDGVNFSEHIGMWYFTEDFNKEVQRVEVGGEVFLNVQTPNQQRTKARIWLWDTTFLVSDNSVELLRELDRDRFMINPSNINPDN